MKEEQKLRLALAIISGRYEALAHMDQWELLGYDPYKFGYYGKPSADEMKQRAEEIIADAILANRGEKEA